MKKYMALFLSLIVFMAGCSPSSEPVSSDISYLQNSSMEEESFVPVGSTDPVLEEWGFAGETTKWVSLNRDYEWYIDQGTTGRVAGNNCAPSCAVMAAKWADESFSITAEQAREEYPCNDGPWYCETFRKFFHAHDISYIESHDISLEKALQALDEGRILLVIMHTRFLTFQPYEEKRIGKITPEGNGHSMIIKGYCVVGGQTYFETYEPSSHGKTYEDGSLVGKDRYFVASEFIEAIKLWVDIYFEFSPKDESITE